MALTLRIAFAVFSALIVMSFWNESESAFCKSAKAETLNRALSPDPVITRAIKGIKRKRVSTFEDAQKRNLEKCPLPLHFDAMIPPMRDFVKGWHAWDQGDIILTRLELARHLEKLGSRALFPKGGRRSNGIVLSGGRGEIDRMARLINTLRSHESTLPVEVFYFQGEMTAEDCALFKDNKTACRTLDDITPRRMPFKKNYHAKPQAIVQSSFSSVLWLDNDVLPLRAPDFLFKEPAFVKTGLLAWPDLFAEHPANPRFILTDRECGPQSNWETGQLLVDKSANNGLNQAAVILAAYMSNKGGLFYRLSYGDKDLFKIALDLLDLPYFTNPNAITQVGRWIDNRFCGGAMLQFNLDKDPKPLFLHANFVKRWKTIFEGPNFTHAQKTHSPLKSRFRTWTPLRHWRPWRQMCIDFTDAQGHSIPVEAFELSTA